MSVGLKERRFPFQGQDDDYIAWLEEKLLTTQSSSTPDNHSPQSPVLFLGPQHHGHTEKLSFIYCTPLRNSKRLSSRSPYYHGVLVGSAIRKRQDKVRSPQWQRELERFVRSIPSKDTWMAKRESCGFLTLESNLLAIRLMLGETASPVVQPVGHNKHIPSFLPPDNSDMILGGCKPSLATTNCSAHGRWAILIAKYQKLIFISYCTVLLTLGNSKQTVNWMMRQYISDSDDKNLERYRLGCIWVHRCISSLLRCGWGYKSWEIFVICAQSPHQYGRFADVSESMSKFVNVLGPSEDPIFEGGWTPYWIPCIIKSLSGGMIELSQICACLGYDCDLVTQIDRNFFQPYDFTISTVDHLQYDELGPSTSS